MSPDVPEDAWTRSAAVLATIGVATLVVAVLLGQLNRRTGERVRHGGPLRRLHEQCKRAWPATAVSVSLLLGLEFVSFSEQAHDALAHVFTITTIATASWLAVKLMFTLEGTATTRLRTDASDNRRARKVRTQLSTLRRLVVAAAVLIAGAAILMTFEPLRAYGASVLASAGVAGVIAGLAAQTTLSNVFAGLQLVFTDALRIDDVVVVEGEWGWIEELTLTYVVVHLWDERRLVLPSSYFTGTPFENWTRTQSRVLGSVYLYLDPCTPMRQLRRKTQEVVEANPLWDQKDWVLQVVDMTEQTVVVRVLASAYDAPTSWDLRCEIREELVTWLQEHHPEALPRTRIEPAGAASQLQQVQQDGGRGHREA